MTADSTQKDLRLLTVAGPESSWAGSVPLSGVQEIAAVVTCKYDYKAAGVADLGTISIRRCSGRGVVEFLMEGHCHECRRVATTL